MDYQEILDRFKEVHVLDLFGTKKEVKELPLILKDNETIMYATSGMMDNNTWLIVCTDQRVLFLDKGMIFGLKQTEIPMEKVNSIAYKTGLMFGQIQIYHGSAQMKIESISKKTVKPMVDAINREIEKLKQPDKQEAATTLSPADEILKYKHLLDADAITQEEFDAKKKQLLGL
jgi:hypothetical protein